MKFKKIGIIAAGLAAAITTSTFLAATPTFSDVPMTHWAYNYVETAADKGWVNGVGDGKYDPNGDVTGAEWITMVVRAFYGDEVGQQQAGDPWYQPYKDVADRHMLIRGSVSDTETMENPLSRYEMAAVIYEVLYDQAGLVDEADPSEIGDWDQIPVEYQVSVAGAYEAGVLTGNDDEGNFDGNESMTRAQAATVLIRLDEAVQNGGSVEPETPVEPEDPEPPEDNPDSQNPASPSDEPASGSVGTLSDTPVTLSYETHKPVTDYWSDAPSDIRAITDQEIYNAAVQVLKDKDIIWDEDVMENGVNPYYNYPVFRYNGVNMTQNQINVTAAVGKMNGYVGFGISTLERYADGTFDKFFTAGKRANSEDYDAVIDPILATLDDNMSDYEKAEILVQAVVDRFEYSTTGNFSWPDPEGTAGPCGPFAHAVNDIFNAAGLPCIFTTGDNHAWSYAYLDGQWYTVDASAVDVAIIPDASLGFTNNIESFHGGPSETDRVAMALIESAYD